MVEKIKEKKEQEIVKKEEVKKVSKLSEMPSHEIQRTVVELANKGKTAAEIGMHLRDEYGVLNVRKSVGKKIEQIMASHKVLGEMPQDLLNLIKRSVSLQKHMKENKKDQTAKYGYQLTVSKIRRLVKYYHSQGKLPKGWRYSPEQAALLVK